MWQPEYDSDDNEDEHTGDVESEAQSDVYDRQPRVVLALNFDSEYTRK